MTKNSHYVILLYDILNLQYHVDADVVELADTQDLGSCAVRCAGSSPVVRTKGSLERLYGFRISDCAAFLYVSVIAFGFSPEFRLEKCRKICYTSVVSIFRGKDPAESAKNHRESP